MQEQLPLRPADFAKTRDGFIAFLRQPAGTPIEQVIPQNVLDAMAAAARRGRSRRVFLNLVMAGAASAVLGGVVIGLAMDQMFGGVAVMLAAGAAFIWAHNRSRVRNELEIDQLLTEPNKTLNRNLRALEEFRSLIGSGDIPCEERLPDGTIKSLSKKLRQAFLADHGALLILSRDQALWECIPQRPIPMSPLWVKVGNRVATTELSARAIMDNPDNELFDKRVEWLLSAANQSNRSATSFRADVCVMADLRRLKLEGKGLEECKALLAKEGYGTTRVAHMNAGIYIPFEKFLATLPLHDFP